MAEGMDYAVTVIYLLGITLFGLWIGRGQRSAQDYFLGGRDLPWWAVTFSIVATETSVLTFISIPGLAYVTNMNFLQFALGGMLGRVAVSFLLIPTFYEGNVDTPYGYIGNRFGGRLQLLSSIVFLITRLLADGVRVFAAAVPLAVLTGLNYPTSILIFGLVTLLYTYVGGIRSVVWVDVVQMSLYVLGAITAGFFIFAGLPAGWDDVVRVAGGAGKFDVFNLGFSEGLTGFFGSNYTVLSGLLGGIAFGMASHGADHLIVQRLLCCRNVRDSQKAMIASGVAAVIQFGLFLTIGAMLYTFYKGASLAHLGLSRPDEVFVFFIRNELPLGLRGLLLAAIFAAAMSTLSSSLNSLASSTMLDLLRRRTGGQQKELGRSKLATVFWGVLLIGFAMLFSDQTNPIVEIGLGIASFTYGGLLGIFILGRLFQRAQQRDAIIGFVLGVLFTIWIIGSGTFGWPWFVLIGSSMTVSFGLISSLFGDRRQ